VRIGPRPAGAQRDDSHAAAVARAAAVRAAWTVRAVR
jgi:hypothetical protein